MNKVSIAYLLWLGGWFPLLPIAGLHRLYNGQLGTGMLWLFTCGLFGFGQLVDLFLIPNMVEEHNIQARARLGLSPAGVPMNQPAIAQCMPVREATPPGLAPQSAKQHEVQDRELLGACAPVPTSDQLMIELVKAAYARGGKLTVTLAVVDTGASFAEVEAALKQMVKSGYVTVGNHSATGVVLYEFIELLTDFDN